MGWFSPVKGSYPSLAQVDKTLPLGSGVVAERGSILAISKDGNGNPVWKQAGGSEDTYYVALTEPTDPTAGFAGTSFTPNPTADFPARPAITAIDLAQDGEYETSVFDMSKTYEVGDKLVVSGGQLSKGDSGTTVGIVTAAPTSRWINNAVAVPKGADRRLAYRTGAREKVIRFKTAL